MINEAVGTPRGEGMLSSKDRQEAHACLHTLVIFGSSINSFNNLSTELEEAVFVTWAQG